MMLAVHSVCCSQRQQPCSRSSFMKLVNVGFDASMPETAVDCRQPVVRPLTVMAGDVMLSGRLFVHTYIHLSSPFSWTQCLMNIFKFSTIPHLDSRIN